jgi:hypothetical protein
MRCACPARQPSPKKSFVPRNAMTASLPCLETTVTSPCHPGCRRPHPQGLLVKRRSRHGLVLKSIRRTTVLIHSGMEGRWPRHSHRPAHRPRRRRSSYIQSNKRGHRSASDIANHRPSPPGSRHYRRITRQPRLSDVQTLQSRFGKSGFSYPARMTLGPATNSGRPGCRNTLPVISQVL